jgi:hypothetical protein
MRVKTVIEWLDAASFLKLLLVYCRVSAIVLVSGVLVFIPVLGIYSILGKEFSNLGPIATFFWGILFELFVVSPLFLLLLLVKMIRRSRR